MMARIALACCLLLGPLVTHATAQTQSLDGLAGSLRPFLASSVPAVLFEKEYGWGHQRPIARGVRWHGVRPELQKSPRNDGIWRKVRVTSQDLPRTLELNLTDFRSVDAERQTFKVFLAFQANVDYEEQTWQRGKRLLSTGAAARLRIKAQLDCENSMRIDTSKGLLPDIVFRLRITHADVSYDNLVVEHVGGVGGSAARLTGEALRSTLKQWKPSLERDLLTRANAAILKAGDTREVRVNLSSLAKAK